MMPLGFCRGSTRRSKAGAIIGAHTIGAVSNNLLCDCIQMLHGGIGLSILESTDLSTVINPS